MSNAEIGSRLYISPATAKTHVARILTKLDARDRAQLIVIAYESRIVRPGEAWLHSGLPHISAGGLLARRRTQP